MKKIILLLAGVLIGFASFAQINKSKPFIVLTTGDTLQGKVEEYDIVADNGARTDGRTRIVKSDGTTLLVMSNTIKSQSLGIKTLEELQLIEVKETKNAKGWLIVSGVTLLSSGLINIYNASRDVKTSSDVNSVKNLSGISYGLQALSGFSLIVGITIHFK